MKCKGTQSITSLNQLQAFSDEFDKCETLKHATHHENECASDHHKRQCGNSIVLNSILERLKGIDEKGMISKCGWEMKKAMCVRFLFVQPRVVSTCSVTERISFVNSLAAAFRKGVLEFVWSF